MPENDPNSRNSNAALIAVVVALVLLPFMPLLVSVAENALYGTHKVEDFFRYVGLHDAMGKFYRMFGKLISRR